MKKIYRVEIIRWCKAYGELRDKGFYVATDDIDKAVEIKRKEIEKKNDWWLYYATNENGRPKIIVEELEIVEM